MTKRYCEFCGKEIAEPSKYHIAGEICIEQENKMSTLQYLSYRFTSWLLLKKYMFYYKYIFCSPLDKYLRKYFKS